MRLSTRSTTLFPHIGKIYRRVGGVAVDKKIHIPIHGALSVRKKLELLLRIRITHRQGLRGMAGTVEPAHLITTSNHYQSERIRE
jgi:hypothetical protein